MVEHMISLPTFNLEVRQRVNPFYRIGVVAASAALGMAISVAILMASGIDLFSIYEEFVVFTFMNSTGLSDVVNESTPLILVGLAATVAFRVNFWNIGIEGQFFFGVIGATFVAIFNIGPEHLRLLLMFVFACLGGALWALTPAILKVKLQVNEVISTLLLNYIAYYFVLDLIYGPWKDPVTGFPYSEEFEMPFERLAEIGWEQVHSGILIAAFAVVILWWLVERCRYGISSRFVGTNPPMALAVGLPVATVTIGSALLSGAMAGLGGFVVATANEFRLTPAMSVGYGFSGIVIAFLAGKRPIPTLVVAFLIGGLYVAGESLKVIYGLSAALVSLIQAIIVLTVISSEFFVRYRLRLVRKKVP